MCISVPAKICSIDNHAAEVEIMGTKRTVLLTAEAVDVGNWVLVYSGIAVSKISEAEAHEILQLLGAQKN